MMSCEHTNLNKRNFNVRYNNTVFSKEITIDEATPEMELQLIIYNDSNRIEKILIDGAGLTRLEPTKWKIEPFIYEWKTSKTYVLRYTKGEIERDILTGKFLIQ